MLSFPFVPLFPYCISLISIVESSYSTSFIGYDDSAFLVGRTNVLEMVAAEVKNCGGAASVATCDVEEWLRFPGGNMGP